LTGRPLRLGIVGCGWVVLDRHLPALTHVQEVEVVGLADLDPAALGRAGRLVPQARQLADVEALVGDPDVEAVAVTVPPAGHVEVALAALAAGKHVLVEKPVAPSLEDADRLVAAAEASPCKVVVGFNFRRHRFVQRARAMIAAGELGEVTCIRSAFTNDVPLDDTARWRGTRSLGGGGILDRAVHEIDLWRYLLADDVAEVSAYSVPGRTEDDVAIVTARMCRGALASIVVLDSAVVSHELTVYGSRATARLDLCRFEGFSVEATGTLPGSPSARLRRAAGMLSDARGAARAIRRGGDFMLTYEDEWRRFAEIIRHDLPADPGVADGRTALEVALAAITSVDTGSPVKLAALASSTP
jgi:predicted dehydrogenase